MAIFYREVSFRTEGPDAHGAATREIDELPALQVLFEDHRALGIMERRRLFGPETQTRLVLEIMVDRDLELERHLDQDGGDPYRTQDFEVVRRLRPELAEILVRLDAKQREVSSAIVNFETRAYTRDVCERYMTGLRDRCEAESLDAELHLTPAGMRRQLVGRIRGPIARIEPIAHDLRTSGYVPFGRAVVKYL